MHQFKEVGAGKLPLERVGDLLIETLKGQQAVGHLGEAGEVIGGEDLSLDHGEINLHLVEPTGMASQSRQSCCIIPKWTKLSLFYGDANRPISGRFLPPRNTKTTRISIYVLFALQKVRIEQFREDCDQRRTGVNARSERHSVRRSFNEGGIIFHGIARAMVGA